MSYSPLRVDSSYSLEIDSSYVEENIQSESSGRPWYYPDWLGGPKPLTYRIWSDTRNIVQGYTQMTRQVNGVTQYYRLSTVAEGLRKTIDVLTSKRFNVLEKIAKIFFGVIALAVFVGIGLPLSFLLNFGSQQIDDDNYLQNWWLNSWTNVPPEKGL